MSLHQASAITISLLIPSIFFNLGYADKLTIQNQMMKRKGVLQVACQAMISKWPWHKISNGDIYTVNLPLGALIDLAPAHCMGKWNDANGEENGIIFSAYDYFRDHQNCRESCEMVAKDGGWYIRSSTSREWELVLRFQSHHPNLVGSGDHEVSGDDLQAKASSPRTPGEFATPCWRLVPSWEYMGLRQ
ncbi:uncharacterized protein A4U43_C07F10440 [Asparagus officinalis]|uniref:S-protein homolog n=1 Tax=Asparagus officinalis TaxID=4686 RepID=A0A5P1EDX3_ASPOF|nr:uncharacterized protein A4U43_C07F10440 [Asparagus officinalis]